MLSIKGILELQAKLTVIASESRLKPLSVLMSDVLLQQQLVSGGLPQEVNVDAELCAAVARILARWFDIDPAKIQISDEALLSEFSGKRFIDRASAAQYAAVMYALTLDTIDSLNKLAVVLQKMLGAGHRISLLVQDLIKLDDKLVAMQCIIDHYTQQLYAEFVNTAKAEIKSLPPHIRVNPTSGKNSHPAFFLYYESNFAELSTAEKNIAVWRYFEEYKPKIAETVLQNLHIEIARIVPGFMLDQDVIADAMLASSPREAIVCGAKSLSPVSHASASSQSISPPEV